METTEKRAVTFDYLSELVYKYQINNYGENPKYISINDTDSYKLKGEIYRLGLTVFGEPSNLRFMGIRVLECINLQRGEVILSK